MKKQTTDTIYINELLIPCIIGVFAQERATEQQIIISLELQVTTEKAAKSDSLDDAVDYHEIAEEVYAKISASEFHLVEKLAETIATICLSDKRVKQVSVLVEKPKALRLAKSAAIKITRTNE